MWKNIINISEFIDLKYSVNSTLSIRHELKVRMSFHVLESYSNRPLKDLLKLLKELKKLNLLYHPVPITFAILIILFRRKSNLFFKFIRFVYQR